MLGVVAVGESPRHPNSRCKVKIKLEREESDEESGGSAPEVKHKQEPYLHRGVGRQRTLGSSLPA